jgi:ERCC4-type nuclease
MGSQVVRVAVDVREPVRIRAELERLGADATVASLPIGDYRMGDVLVERKTVAGGLGGQLGRLRAGAPRPFLLVEGAALDSGPLSPAAVRGALLAAAENGVTVVRSESLTDTALWLYRIGCRGARRRRDRPEYAQRPKVGTPEAVLASIPGISAVTARELLAHFGTVAEVVAATDLELRDVSGVGPFRAQAIRAALTRPPTSYRSRRSRE